MKTADLHDIFEKFEDDYLKFERVENKRSQRPDLHAFLLLDEIFPGNRDIVGAAEHDEFWLGIELDEEEELPAALTEERILELNRCGVRWCEDVNSFAMFT